MTTGVPRNVGDRRPGRPSLGTTRKVSLTLTDEEWERIESSDHPSVGSYVRELILKQQRENTAWFARNSEIIDGVVKHTGYKDRGFGSEWAIDFDELSRITNGHPEFMDKVKEVWEKESNSNNIYNAAVYRYHKDGREHISIAIDVIDNHIELISCAPDYAEGHPYVLSTSYNKSYVWEMASLL